MQQTITGMVLAGGRATRMGGEDKGLITLRGRPMVAHVVARLRPQVHELLINANRNQERYGACGAAVIGDHAAGFLGPLAGMASGMRAAACPLLVTVPCDSPFVPGDLVGRLLWHLQQEGRDIAVAHDGQRLQPVFALLRCTLRESLERYLAEGQRKIDRWYALHGYATVDFSDAPDAFRNINTPQEHAEIEALLAAG